jgi:hypothetical protein
MGGGRFLIAILLLSSCFTPREIRRNARAERLVERAVQLNPEIQTTTVDTVFTEVTVTETEFITDTIIQNPFEGDSIVVRDSLGRAEAFLVFHSFAPRLGLTIPERSFTVTTPTTINKTEVKPSGIWTVIRSARRWWIVAVILAGLIALAGLLKRWSVW